MESLLDSKNHTLYARVSSRLMENYRFGKTVTQETEFIVAKGSHNELDLFYIGPKAESNDRVYNLQMDDKVETGWRHTDLENSFIPAKVTAALDPVSQKQVVFAQSLNDFSPDIYYTQEISDGKWDKWKLIDTSQANNIPDPSSVMAIKAEVINGKLELFVVLGNSPGKEFNPLTLWRVQWDSPTPEWQRMGNVDSTYIKYCKTKKFGEGLLVTSISSKDPSKMDLNMFLPPYKDDPVNIIKEVRSSQISIEEKKDGNSGIFLYCDIQHPLHQGIYFIDCAESEPSPVLLPNTGTLNCRQILAIDAGELPLTLYALTFNNILYCIKQDHENGEWKPPLPLGFQFSYINGGKNKDDYPQIYGINTAGDSSAKLECICKSPPLADKEMAPGWQKFSIDLPVEKMEVIPSYAVELFIYDDEGSIKPNCPVEIATTELTELMMDGKQIMASPKSWVPLKTNEMGKITLYTSSRAINAPKLLLRYPESSNSNQQQVVDINTVEFRKMKSISIDEVKNLLPEKYKDRAKDVHDGVTKALSFVETLPNREPSFIRPGIDSVHKPIDMANAPKECWSFSTTSGMPEFRILSKNEAETMCNNLMAEAENGIISDIIQWFTDAVETVAHGLVKAFTVIYDGAKLIIEMIVEGVKYVFSGVIKFIEEALQVAESILHSVGVFFKKLFEFIGAILLKIQKDVWNTKAVFEKAINHSFEQLITYAEEGKKHSSGFFDNLKSTVDEDFNKIINKLGNQTFDYNKLLPAYNSNENGNLLDQMEETSVNANLVMNKVFSPLGSSMKVDVTIAEELKQAIENFKNTAGSSISQAFKDSLQELEDFIIQSAQNPEMLFQLAIKTVLELTKNLVDVTIDITSGLVTLFLDLVIVFVKAIRDYVFNKPIKGFFFQALYDLINPNMEKESLTLTRLIALICAFPVTVVEEVLFKKPPFEEKVVKEILASKTMFPVSVYSENLSNADKQNLLDDTIREFHFMSGVLKVVLVMPSDIFFDMPAAETPPSYDKFVIGCLSNSIPLFVIGLGAPGGVFQFSPWDKLENQGANINWLLSLPIPCWGIMCALVGVSARVNPVTCGILSFLGCVSFGGAIFKQIMQIIAGKDTPLNTFASLPSSLTFVAKPLRFAPEKLKLLAFPALWGLDLVIDTGTGACKMVENWPESAEMRAIG